MKKICLLVFIVIAVNSIISCNNNDADKTPGTTAGARDTITYPYKATYSSDLAISSHPEYAQKVLTVWKLFENKQIDSMKSYYADTVTYETADGGRFYGPASQLLALAKKEMDGMDSLRFDISSWETVHSNDKNEDWVNIWCDERSYPKSGKADTMRMFEKWGIKDGRVNYFNQYYAKIPKK